MRVVDVAGGFGPLPLSMVAAHPHSTQNPVVRRGVFWAAILTWRAAFSAATAHLLPSGERRRAAPGY